MWNRALTVTVLAIVAMASAWFAGDIMARRAIQSAYALPEAKAVEVCKNVEVSHSISAPNFYSDAAPPQRFRSGGTVTFRFMSQPEVTADCSRDVGPPVCGGYWKACTRGREITAPNPCEMPGEYAATLCHELAHANGWPGDHGE